MAEYIEREAALAALCKDCSKMVPPDEREPCRYRFTGCMEYYNIFELAAADVRPVVHARWLDGYRRQPCPICCYKGMRSWRFCPQCGAMMDGEG